VKIATTVIIGCVLLLVSTGQADAPSLARAARLQIGKTVRYDPSYQSLKYPNGDVPIEVGVCSDVVVRALRAFNGMDLQKLVHEDMKNNFAEYPQRWGLKAPDKNIDHRRVPNLQTFFKRNGLALPTSRNPNDYQPNDIVTCIVPPNLPHIMIVSDRTNATGRPLIIHNIGDGTREEDRLLEFQLTGHYRIKRVISGRNESPSVLDENQRSTSRGTVR
jgi:uncharacterized protein